MSANNVNEINDQVASILGITDAPITNAPVLVIPSPLPPLVVRVAPLPVPVSNTGDVINDDAENARNHLYDVLSKTTTAIGELAVVAQQSQSARSYEVLNQLLKTQSEVARELLKLQQDRQKVTGTAIKPSGNTNIANAIFVGTNAELLDLIKGRTSADDARTIHDAEFLTDSE